MAPPPPSITRRGVFGLAAAASIGAAPRVAGAAPQGELRIASHVSLAPTWFDPAETAGIITPFMMLYAMHDAMLKAMPDRPDGAVPGRILHHGARRAELRLHAAQRACCSTMASR
jgi:hypothetical protein